MKLFGRKRLLVGVLAGALASVVLAWILFDPGADASRVYYGTDTHAVASWSESRWPGLEPDRAAPAPHRPARRPILDVVGVLALAYIVLGFIHVHDYDLALWHGGYSGWPWSRRCCWPSLRTRGAPRLDPRPSARPLARPAQLQLLPLALAGAGLERPEST